VARPKDKDGNTQEATDTRLMGTTPDSSESTAVHL